MKQYVLSDLFPGNYPIAQYFGERPSYYKQFGLAGHEGIDWACPVGVSLLCPFELGQVLRSAWDPNYGFYSVIWDASQRCAVWYCHQRTAPPIHAGQMLKRFDVVGRTGSTGNVTGPHLHFGFVETDGFANRLNRANGYQGFMNALKPGYIAWQLSK